MFTGSLTKIAFLYQKWVFVPKMGMDILCWDGHFFRLNSFPSGSENFRDGFWWILEMVIGDLWWILEVKMVVDGYEKSL